MPNIVARYRSQDYPEDAWIERDNFETKEKAIEYTKMNMGRFKKTPYRVVQINGRYIVEFIPEWKMHNA